MSEVPATVADGHSVSETMARIRRMVDKHEASGTLLFSVTPEADLDYKEVLKKRRKYRYDLKYRQARLDHYAALMRRWRKKHPERAKELNSQSHHKNRFQRSKHQRRRYRQDHLMRMLRQEYNRGYKAALRAVARQRSHENHLPLLAVN